LTSKQKDQRLAFSEMTFGRSIQSMDDHVTVRSQSWKLLYDLKRQEAELYSLIEGKEKLLPLAAPHSHSQDIMKEEKALRDFIESRNNFSPTLNHVLHDDDTQTQLKALGYMED